MMDSPLGKPIQTDLLRELKRSNELIATFVRNQTSWKLALRQGMVVGLGGVLGATLLVSLLIAMLQPFKRLEILKPTLDRIAQELERRPAK